MKLTRALPLVLVFGATAFPQNPGKQFSSGNARTNCPIELKASLRIAGNVVPITPVGNGQSTGEKEQLEITLSDPKSDVKSARITIYGFPIGGRVDPAVLYSPHAPAEIKKTIGLSRTVAVGGSTSYEVAIPDFSTVTSIDLDSVVYSDGTSWHSETPKSCQALPLPIDTAKPNSR
jgi:hypothetical protein